MCKVYITFLKKRRPKGRKTDVWEILTMDKDELGFVKFRGAWRQYVFEPGTGTYWNSGCLEEITEFIKEQNDRWRKGLVKR